MFPSRKFITLKARSLFSKQVAIRAVHTRGQLIQVGDSLPQADLYEDCPTKIVRSPDLMVGRNVVLFGVPGAFTPGCSKSHMPGYLRLAMEMKTNGIDEIVCVSVNDPYVMGAWAAKHKTKGKIRLLADPCCAFIGAMGLAIHIPTLGGFRSKRFSMVITDNVIKELNIEPDFTGLSCSLATELDYKEHIRTEDDYIK